MGVAAGTPHRSSLCGLSQHLRCTAYDPTVRDAYTLVPAAIGTPLAFEGQEHQVLSRDCHIADDNLADKVVTAFRRRIIKYPSNYRSILQVWLETDSNPTVFLGAIDCSSRNSQVYNLKYNRYIADAQLRLENLLEEALSVSKFAALSSTCGGPTENGGKVKAILRFDQSISILSPNAKLAEDTAYQAENIPNVGTARYPLAVFRGLGSLGTCGPGWFTSSVVNGQLAESHTVGHRWSGLLTNVRGDVVASISHDTSATETLDVMEQLMAATHGETPADLGYVSGTLQGSEVHLILIPSSTDLNTNEEGLSVLVDSFDGTTGEEVALNIKRSGFPDGNMTQYSTIRSLAKAIVHSVDSVSQSSSVVTSEKILTLNRPYWILRFTTLLEGLSSTELVTVAKSSDVLDMMADTALASLWYDIRDACLLCNYRLEDLSYVLELLLALTETINEAIQVSARVSPYLLSTTLRVIRDQYLSPHAMMDQQVSGGLCPNSTLHRVLLNLLSFLQRAGKQPNNSEACKATALGTACIAMFLTSIGCLNGEKRINGGLADILLDFWPHCNEYLRFHDLSCIDPSSISSIYKASAGLWELSSSLASPSCCDTAQVHALAAQHCMAIAEIIESDLGSTIEKWSQHLLKQVTDKNELNDMIELARGKQRLQRALTLCQLTTYEVAFTINEAFASHLFGQPNALAEMWADVRGELDDDRENSGLTLRNLLVNPLRMLERPMCAPRVEFLNLLELTECNYQIQNTLPSPLEIIDRGSDEEEYLRIPCSDGPSYTVNDLACLMQWFIEYSLENLEGVRWETNVPPKVTRAPPGDAVAILEATSHLEENNFINVLEEALLHATSRHLISSMATVGRKSAARRWNNLYT